MGWGGGYVGELICLDGRGVLGGGFVFLRRCLDLLLESTTCTCKSISLVNHAVANASVNIIELDASVTLLIS